MQDLEIKIKVTLCQMDELSAEDQALVGQAIEATRHSYAVYSHFHVGAAVRLQDGRVVIGANQENAAFPSGLCAERTALFAAQAHYPDQPVLALAIAARNAVGLTAQPVTPCGACRQVALEVDEPLPAADARAPLWHRGRLCRREHARPGAALLLRRGDALRPSVHTHNHNRYAEKLL